MKTKQIYTALVTLMAVLMMLHSGVALADNIDHRFGLGITLGIPDGLSGKYWLDDQKAVEGSISYVSGEYSMLTADYLSHYRGLFKSNNAFVEQLEPYFGAGGVLVVTNHDRTTDDHYYSKSSGGVGLGFRIPLGIEWKPTSPTVGVFAEIAPGISIVPSTAAFVMWGVGGRYYF